MTKKMDKKGQTALETAFVVLFIITAIWAISARTMRYTEDISQISAARAEAQGVALALTMGGTTTHLVRIDENSSSGSLAVDLYVMSEDCDEAETKFRADMGLVIDALKCESRIYLNTDDL